MIDILVWKCESFDTVAFKEELDEAYPNNIYLVMKLGNGIYLNDKLIFKNTGHFIFYELVYFFIMLYFCLRYRPRIVYIEHTYLIATIGILRKIGWIKKLIHFPGDWLENKYYPYLDWLACYWADVVWDTAQNITNKRFNRWNRDITKKVIHYHMRIRKNFIYNDNADKVLFHGEARKDSGIELAKKNKLFEIKIPGFLYREDLKEAFDDCFCGINLITSQNSWTTNSFPSKIGEYLQFGLPPIVSNNCGYVCDVIRKYKLGVVIKPTVANFEMALNRVYYNRETYRNNIEKYIEMSSKPRLKDILSD